MATWLQGQEWQMFVTLTTPWELTIASGMRSVERFFDRARKNVFNGAEARMFYVMERYELKDGYHLHGLLNYDITSVMGVPNLPQVLSHTWNVVSGAYGRQMRLYDDYNGRIIKPRRHFRSSFTRYDAKRSAGKYCSKYLLKRHGEYGILV